MKAEAISADVHKTPVGENSDLDYGRQWARKDDIRSVMMGFCTPMASCYGIEVLPWIIKPMTIFENRDAHDGFCAEQTNAYPGRSRSERQNKCASCNCMNSPGS